VKALIPTVASCVALAVAGCGGDDSSSGSTESTGATTAKSTAAAKKTKPGKVFVSPGPPPKKLVVDDLEKGSGAVAKTGDQVTVQYVGLDYKNGKEFDTSWGREPFVFELGGGLVIAGWDKGVEGMRVGGRRQLTVPPDLAYGAAGSPPTIAPNSTLVFVIDLLAVE